MSDLEGDLREALKRLEPPSGFDQRVLARVAAAQSARRRWWDMLRLPSFRLAVAAAALILVAGSWVQYRRGREEARGQRARRQLLVALRITGSKLELAREKVLERSRQSIDIEGASR